MIGFSHNIHQIDFGICTIDVEELIASDGNVAADKVKVYYFDDLPVAGFTSMIWHDFYDYGVVHCFAEGRCSFL